MANIRSQENHAYKFWLKAGFKIVGLMPDAEGRGRPGIHLAKQVEATTHETLKDLTPREAYLLRTRFGIDLSKEPNLEDVHKQMEATRQRIAEMGDKFRARIQEKRCSFCGKSSNDVTKLLAAQQANICDACVQTCLKLLDD